ncbi:Putative uncharacterized protein [Pararhodospirillum photometricum DSM 122]|uniref:Uncharacterized protein n=2 Tax=Pararhodospirillum photometricum TaxID=1084 RepID=H6SQC9_PARPM|nr:Putative uncharacterized protein [Pararhodospirillum photometricum DSM 122]
MWMFGLNKPFSWFRDIKPRDRFAKTDGETKSVWVVDRVIEVTNMPPHARLIRQGDRAGGYRTISVRALADPTLYRRLPPTEAEA